MAIKYDKNKDSYDILGIPPTSTDEEIKKRYRDLCRQYHPDLNKDAPLKDELQRKINDAYNNICPKNRAAYDTERRNALGIKGKIKTSLNTINDKVSKMAFRFVNSSSIENLEAYDQYIEFLDELEPQFLEYGESTKPFLEGVLNKRGKISKETLEQYKKTIKRELEYIKMRAAAFDEFQKFYTATNETIVKLYNKKLNLKEYTDINNRTKYNQLELEEKKLEIKNFVKKLNEERLKKLDSLKIELGKRYIRYNEFLELRGLKEETISTNTIKKLQSMLSIIDQIRIKLNKMGIALEDYLINMGLNIMTVTEKQLESILQSLNPSGQNLEELDKILRGEDGDRTMGK
ncbi:MAG: J domain-containing protein [Bacilli bacterium]|nr:J domain-containing protein [Bacilli bacterium]